MNKYLKSARNPPAALTPDINEEFHPQIKVEQLRSSKLERNFHPPEIKGRKPSTDEEQSALIPMSVRAIEDSSWPSDPASRNFGRSSSFFFDIDQSDDKNQNQKNVLEKKKRENMKMLQNEII